MGESLRFGVLGPVTVVRSGVEVPVTAAMPRAVLAALLLGANKPVPARRLESVLWQGGAPLRSGASLHNHVHRLRRQLGDSGRERIQTTPSGYVLQVRAGELDVHDFAELHERGGRARLDRNWPEVADALSAMLALWRGETAADVDYQVLDDVDRERLREMRVQALDWRAQADLRLGRHAEMVADLRAVVAEHPLAETFPAHLMLALHRCGRGSEALDVFQSTRSNLRRELGVSPGAALVDLNRRILDRDPRLDWRPVPPSPRSAAATTGIGIPAKTAPTPRTLPAAIPDFTAREAEISRLIRAVTHPCRAAAAAVPVAVIGGMAGIGKSALAIHVAHLVQDGFSDGQLFADLKGSTANPASAHTVLAMFLSQLGLDAATLPAGTEERSALLRSLLADRKVLLVLDDVHDDRQLAALLPGGPGCAVLATSRTRLTAIPGCLHIDLDTLAEAAAHQVLDRLTGPDRLAAEPAATAVILDACAGLPLALRIAAGRLTARSAWRVADLADRFEAGSARGRRLDEFVLAGVDLRSGLAAMYAALAGTPQQRALCLLGGPIGSDTDVTDVTVTVTAAAGLLDVPTPEAEHILEALVDAHLVRSPRPGRYELHPLVRDFARERAAHDLAAAAPSRLSVVPLPA